MIVQFLLPKIDVEGRNDQILKYLPAMSNRRRPLFGLTITVIQEHWEEGAIFLKKVSHVETLLL